MTAAAKALMHISQDSRSVSEKLTKGLLLVRMIGVILSVIVYEDS